MRILFAAFFAAPLLISGASHSQAEKRVFIIANSPDSYGIDRCLAGGHACGAAAAAAYCESKDFSKAASYRRVNRDEITGAAPTDGAACGRNGCDEFVAIECTR
jgi:hypothetical protein